MTTFTKNFQKCGVYKKAPKNLHTSVLDRQREKCFWDYEKPFVSMLILLVCNQIWGNVKKNLGNVPELSFQLSFSVIGQKISGFFLIQQTESPRKRLWDLMIHITAYYSQRDLEFKFFKHWIKTILLITVIFWYVQFPSYTIN